MADLSEVLAAEVERQNLTQLELCARAARAGHTLSQGRLAEVLGGKTADPRLSTLRAILAGLGKSLGWLERKLKDESQSTGG